jgi:hypothetical protein
MLEHLSHMTPCGDGQEGMTGDSALARMPTPRRLSWPEGRALATKPIRQMRGERPEIPGHRNAGTSLATPTSEPAQEHARVAAL